MNAGARGPRCRGPRTALAALSAGLLLGCLKDGPIVSAGQVYDPEAAILRAHLSGLDSVEIQLVDAADSNRVVSLWSGHPDSADRLPVHVAAEGETWYFRLRGHREGKGHCYLETIRAGTSIISLDACEDRPIPVELADPLADFAGDATELRVRIRARAPFEGKLELRSDEAWILRTTDSLRLDSTGPDAGLLLRIRRELLEPGDHRGMAYLHDSAGVCDSMIVTALSDSIDIFGRDSLNFGNTDSVHIIPYLVPVTSNRRWLALEPPAWLLTGPPIADPPAGTVMMLKLHVDRSLAEGDRMRFATVIYARGRDGVAMDSLVVTMGKDDWPGGIRGSVVDWNKMQPIEGAKVELWADSTAPYDSAVTDENGAFVFRSLRSGSYRLAATAASRLGAMLVQGVKDRDTAATLRVSPPIAFKEVETGWPADRRIGSAAVVGQLAVVPSQSATQPGQVLIFPYDDPAKRRYIPQANAAPDSSGRYLRAAEVAGISGYLFISYPADSTIGMIVGWDGDNPRTVLLKVPFQPFGLQVENLTMAAAGWKNDSQYVFATWRIEGNPPDGPFSLEMQGMDVIGGNRPNSRDTLGTGPMVASDLSRYYFIGDGTPATGKVSVREANGKAPAQLASWLAATPGNGLCHHSGFLYVASSGFVRIGLRGGIFDQKVTGMVPTGQRMLRIAAGEFIGRTYAFATTTAEGVHVIVPEHHRALGKLALPSSRQPRSVAVYPKDHHVLISDGEKIFMLEQER